MKKTILMASAVLSVFLMSSCRSSKNLTEATAVVTPSSSTVEEVAPVVYSQPQRTESYVAPTTTTVQPVVMPGDRTEAVTIVNSADAALLKNYNVVVGAFGSKANAENFKSVMVGRGFNAFLVQNPQGLYRVVAASYNDHAQAVQARDNIRSKYSTDDSGTCPAAWILVPTR